MGGHDNEDSGANHERKTCSPFFYAKSATERPLMTCCSFCCGMLFFLVILAGMIATGVEVIRFSSDVPFYLYDHISYKREVALRSAFDVADARLDGDPRERENADEFSLSVIYELDDADALLSPEVLASIKEMEEKIVAVAEYTKFCALNYDFDESNPICVRQDSVVNYFDPSWWVPATSPPSEPTVPSEYNAVLALNQSKMASSDQDLYYAFANPQESDEAGAIDLSQDNVDTVVQYWSGYCSDAAYCPAAANGDISPYAMTVNGVNVSIASPISQLMDANFGIQESGEVVSTAQAMMSVFYFGSPQRKSSGELADTDTDGVISMADELGQFLLDDVVDILKAGAEGVNVFWEGENNGLLNIYINQLLASDSSLMIVSILFIVVYLIISLKSWWLGTVGILMILGNFGPALIVYRLISGYNYFGTLNALSVFLVLGVGADDIFVFVNTWKHVRRNEPDLPVVDQLRHALSQGGKAMFVTSVTTSISFLMNATSLFPAVRSFGIFSAVLIMVNFFSVITLYPAATMVYEYYFYDSKTKKNCCLATCGCCKKSKGYNSTEGAAAPEGGALVKFFENTFYPFIHKFRIVVVVVFAGILAFYIALGSQLEPESEDAAFLPDDDQYTMVTEKIKTYFSHSDVDSLLTVQIPFALVGSDRGDCGGDKCDPTIDTDYGAPVWGNIDGLSEEYTQKWFLDFCDAIDTAEDAFDARQVYEADEVIAVPVRCPIAGFQRWCQQQDGVCEQTHPTLSTDEYVVDADLFHETLLTFLRDEVPVSGDTVLNGAQTNLDIWQNTVRFESAGDEVDANPTLRYITVNVQLSAGFRLQYDKGITLYNDWISFVDSWVAKASTAEYQGADATVADAFVTDPGAFHYFYLQKRIVREAMTGIGLSLLGALVIATLATSNWIISSLAIFIIASLVGGVVMFTVINGWKLGILEAILFVMVVGFSVDYTLHLSDSYLESTKKTRGDRTRDMLTTMGPSVLSGAVSTIGATFPLLFAVFVFFHKFGTVIFFIIAQSLIFSLFLFAALLDIFGPEEPEWGAKIKKGNRVLIRETPGDGVLHVENDDISQRAGKVVAVDLDAQMCTVILEGDEANGGGTSAGSEKTVALASVRQRYQTGHIPAIDTGFEALGRVIAKCCGGISCFFVSSKSGGKSHGSKAVACEGV